MAPYAGLPEGAVVYEGLPEGATIVESPKSKDKYASVRNQVNATSFGGGKPIDTRKISYTDQKAKPEQTRQNRKQMADVARPILEGGGAVAGGVLGAATPATPVGGAAIGYGTGKELADLLEGAPTPQYTGNPLVDAAIETGGDLTTGATYEMGGQVLGKVAGKVIDGVRSLKTSGLPFSETRAKVKAGNILDELLQSSPVSAATNAAKEAEANAVLQRTGATANPTPGQATGNIRAASFEQSMAARSPELAERLKFNDASLNESALNNLLREAGQVQPPITAQPAQQTGEEIISTINAQKAATKPVHEALYRNLPNTALPTDDIAATVKALKADFRPGDEAVYPSGLIAKLEELLNLSKAKAPHGGHGAKPAPPEFGSADIQTWAAKKAVDPTIPEVGFQDLHSLRKDIGRQIDSALSGANPNRELAMKLTKLKDAIDRTIETNLGTNEAYTAAKSAYVDYAQKFKTGAVNDVTKRGKQITGLRTPEEAVPGKFFNPSGADDLIRSVGQVTAKRQMLPHVQSELAARTVGPDGVMHIPRAMAYLRQNQATLDKLGLSESVRGMIREQIPAFLRAQIESRGVDVAGNPIMTARQAQKMLRDLAPAMKQVYNGNMKPLTALRDYHKMLEILGRNKGVSFSGNSTTVEKGLTIEQLLGWAPSGSLGRKLFDTLSSTIIGGSTGAAIGGPIGAAVGGTAGLVLKSAANTAAEHQRHIMTKLLEDAITNPETADMLMKLARGAKVTPAQIDSRLMTLGLIGADNAMPEAEPQQPTEYIWQDGELIPQ